MIRCSCKRAGLSLGVRQCFLCEVDEINGVAIVRPPADELCDCGRIAIANHRCRFCALYRADPVDQVHALYLAALSAEDALSPSQRVDVRNRLIATYRERLTARLARGPV